MTAWTNVTEMMRSAWPPQRFRDVGVVLGVSGGADSTALLVALDQLRRSPSEHTPQDAKGFLVVAHFNHALRAEESDADEQFVQSLAGQLGLRYASRRAEQIRRDEASMSALRMKFLIETAKQHGARYIALAHSLDDNIETMLHHLMRGTGPAGLCGIGSPRSVDDDLVIIRPMLSIDRQTIRDGLQEIAQSWREDSSNQSRDYSRNWIRHELIPLIKSRYPDASAAMARAIDGQRDWRSTMDRLAADWIDTHQVAGSSSTFGRDRNADTSVLIAAMQMHWGRCGWPRQAMARQHWNRLAATIGGVDHDRYCLPGDVDVVAKGDLITLDLMPNLTHHQG